MIVDYKTDAVPDPQRLVELTGITLPGQIIPAVLETLTGTRVIEVGLYFVSADVWVTV